MHTIPAGLRRFFICLVYIPFININQYVQSVFYYKYTSAWNIPEKWN